MVVQAELSDTEVDAIFRALADATRRDILTHVLRREQSVTSLSERYSMSFAAVQKHVAVLERASLVTKQRQGKEQLVHANPESIRSARALLDEYAQMWRSRVDRMDSLLTEHSD